MAIQSKRNFVVRGLLTVGVILSTLIVAISIGQMSKSDGTGNNATAVTWLAIGLFAFAISLGRILVEAFAQASQQNKAQHVHVQLSRGLCPTCGYDIRSAGDRCPECGTIARVSSPEVS